MTTFILITAVAICLVGLSKGGLGSMLAPISTPLMALIMPADRVIGVMLPILLLADLFAVAAHWQRWDRRYLFLLLPGAVVGVGVGTLFLTSISPLTLRRGIGIIALLFVVYKIFEPRLLQAVPYRPRPWHGVLAGGIAGITSTLAHVGPPPVTIYLLMQEITPRTFVATAALFFAVVNLIKIPSYFYAGLFDLTLLRQVVWLLPLLPVSIWAGKLISEKLNRTIFDRAIAGLLALFGLFLLFG